MKIPKIIREKFPNLWQNIHPCIPLGSLKVDTDTPLFFPKIQYLPLLTIPLLIIMRVTLKWWYHRFGGRALRYQGRLKVPTKCLHSCGKSDKAKCFHRNNIISQTELNIRPKSLKQNDSKTYCLVTLEEIRLGSLEPGKLHCL